MLEIAVGLVAALVLYMLFDMAAEAYYYLAEGDIKEKAIRVSILLVVVAALYLLGKLVLGFYQ